MPFIERPRSAFTIFKKRCYANYDPERDWGDGNIGMAPLVERWEALGDNAIAELNAAAEADKVRFEEELSSTDVSKQVFYATGDVPNVLLTVAPEQTLEHERLDMDMPLHPCGAYESYMLACLPAMLRSYPHINSRDMHQLVADTWRNLSGIENNTRGNRATFTNMAAQAMGAYEIEMAAYKLGPPVENM
jgi:hypothetical protein